MMNRPLIALALLALLPLAAKADDRLSYTYVEAGYVNADGDADGFGLRGSVSFGASGMYGFAGYSEVEIDNTNIDVGLTRLGIGYAHGLSDSLDLISELAYLNADADGASSIDGYGISVGLRGSLGENFEGLVKANYTDGDGLDGDFTGTIGGQYKFNRTWGLVGEVEFGNGDQTYLLGVRASF
ncbi:MAG: hypothetical protein KatS3mg126_0061 [Lysobacteraceae bacterium]|nr:MAG: hypothetical protein KatS3mg126_0061 [Xanthomonadaceae bacterium]